MRDRRQIAEQILGEMLGTAVTLEEGGFCPCPGKDRHTKGDGARDFRVVLDGAPTGYCFHGSCSEVVADFNKRMRQAIWREERGDDPTPGVKAWDGVAAAPRADRPARPEFDRYSVWEFTRGVPAIDRAWCRRHSPMDVESAVSADFLRVLYEAGERVLIFTDWKTQGDFIWCAQGPVLRGVAGTFRLSQDRGVKAVASCLPKGAKEGVWFLTNPVTGQWAVKPKVNWDAETRTRETQGEWTRRSQVNVTAWRYFVLESDVLGPEEWLKVLVNVPLPIAAIYTSGGRSIHALVKYDVPSKAAWDAVRNGLRQFICPLGADPAALTAVRLSRLPGCLRGERMQELLYLNPAPEHVEIRLSREYRA